MNCWKVPGDIRWLVVVWSFYLMIARSGYGKFFFSFETVTSLKRWWSEGDRIADLGVLRPQRKNLRYFVKLL